MTYTCPNCGEYINSAATAHTCPFPLGGHYAVTFPAAAYPNSAPLTIEQRLAAHEWRIAALEARQETEIAELQARIAELERVTKSLR